MSLQDRVRAQEPEPPIFTIVGISGSGKTTLASTFPKPIFLKTIGEAVPRDIATDLSIVDIRSKRQLFETLTELYNEDHDYKTVVIDSVSGLEEIFYSEILAAEPATQGIARALGGYGAAYKAAAATHGLVRKHVERLREERGMMTVFLAHTDVDKLDLPDSEPFNQYTLRLNRFARVHYIDSVDFVGFLGQERILLGEDGKKKAITSGGRILKCTMEPASSAKNRFGITEDLEVEHGKNPLAPWLRSERASKIAKSAGVPAAINEEEEEN